ncbi:MAG: hypothetical protein EAZ24_02890, partial [Burkholderiales bacterium]
MLIRICRSIGEARLRSPFGLCGALGIAVAFAASLIPASHAVSIGAAAPLTTARSNHNATQMTNGKLLVVGGQSGSNTPLTSVEIYDPFGNAWSAGAALATARTDHTATLLDNGRVLVVGGRSNAASEAALATAVIYDPAANTWSTAGSLSAARSQHTATRLRSGKILVVGGKNNATVLSSAEIYDPATNAWTSAGSMASARRFHTATAAAIGINDDMFVIGGLDVGNDTVSFGLNSIERYSASTNSWFTFSAQLIERRFNHTATALPNGDIVIAGGRTARVSGLSVLPDSLGSTEIFRFATFTMSPAGSLRDARSNHSATLVPSGKLMLMGGVDVAGVPIYRSSVEIYDPAVDTWSLAPSLPTARANHTATLMPTGAVIAVGGRESASAVTATTSHVRPSTISNGTFATTNNCGIGDSSAASILTDGRILITGVSAGSANTSVHAFTPSTSFCDTASIASMNERRRHHTATVLPTGRVLVVGGRNPPSEPIDSAELYDPATNAWTLIDAKMRHGRSGHTATLLADGRVFVSGGLATNQSGGTSFDEPEIFDPATQTWENSGIAGVPASVAGVATLMTSGKVLLVGGGQTVNFKGDCAGPLNAQSLVVDVAMRTTQAATLANAGCDGVLALLPSGKILFAGGGTGISSDVFDPATNTWTGAGLMSTFRGRASATHLPTGEILVSGGVALEPSSSADIYNEATASWRREANLASPRAAHSSALTLNGSVALFGGFGPVSANAETITLNLAPASAQQPTISTFTTTLSPTTALFATGTRFRPALQASGGDAQQSASNAPVFELQRIDND